MTSACRDSTSPADDSASICRHRGGRGGRGGLAAGVPGELSDRWSSSCNLAEPDRGSHASRARRVHPPLPGVAVRAGCQCHGSITGSAPEPFEYWWARERELDTFVRDGHSLYLETLAEVGIVGPAPPGADREPAWWAPEARSAAARAAAGDARRGDGRMRTFMVAATVDWVWELPVLPVAFLVLSAAILGTAGPRRRTSLHEGARIPEGAVDRRLGASRRGRAASLVAIASPMGGGDAGSRQSTGCRRGGAGLSPRRRQGRPKIRELFAARPLLQEALVPEEAGPRPRRRRSRPRNQRACQRSNWTVLGADRGPRHRHRAVPRSRPTRRRVPRILAPLCSPRSTMASCA